MIDLLITEVIVSKLHRMRPILTILTIFVLSATVPAKAGIFADNPDVATEACEVGNLESSAPASVEDRLEKSEVSYSLDVVSSLDTTDMTPYLDELRWIDQSLLAIWFNVQSEAWAAKRYWGMLRPV